MDPMKDGTAAAGPVSKQQFPPFHEWALYARKVWREKGLTPQRSGD
jgi:hypothetical protein